MDIHIEPEIESKRLEALKKYEILDSEIEEIYEDVTKLAAEICGTPIALISLVDSDRLWFKSNYGFAASQTDRRVGFCSQAIQQDRLLVVKDAITDPKFSNNPFVISNPNIRFYAGAPLKAPCGAILGTLCVIDHEPRELTEQQYNTLTVLAKQVVDQFEMRVTQKRLEKDSELNQQMCQQKDDILNTISHDLKGALSTIVGLSEMLLEYLPKEADEDCVKMVENIHHSGEASVKLLKDVLQWSICQGQQCEYQPKKIPLKEVINDALDLVVANFMQKEQTFQVNCPEAMYVMGDRQMICSIIQNLLCNACKFTPENGRIYVTVDQENGTAKVRVTDTGKGVEPEQLKAIQKGKRAISMRGTNGEKGTGFGLMLCRQFVEKQNGRFEVRSELEKGTEFSFTIPVS